MGCLPPLPAGMRRVTSARTTRRGARSVGVGRMALQRTGGKPTRSKTAVPNELRLAGKERAIRWASVSSAGGTGVSAMCVSITGARCAGATATGESDARSLPRAPRPSRRPPSPRPQLFHPTPVVCWCCEMMKALSTRIKIGFIPVFQIYYIFMVEIAPK